MNNLELWIYLIGIIDKIYFVIGPSCVIMLLLSLAVIPALSAEGLDWDDIKKCYRKAYLVTFLSLIAIALLVPSQKTMYAMLSVHTIKQIASSEKADAITQKSILLLEKKIDQLLGRDDE